MASIDYDNLMKFHVSCPVFTTLYIYVFFAHIFSPKSHYKIVSFFCFEVIFSCCVTSNVLLKETIFIQISAYFECLRKSSVCQAERGFEMNIHAVEACNIVTQKYITICNLDFPFGVHKFLCLSKKEKFKYDGKKK